MSNNLAPNRVGALIATHIIASLRRGLPAHLRDSDTTSPARTVRSRAIKVYAMVDRLVAEALVRAA